MALWSDIGTNFISDMQLSDNISCPQNIKVYANASSQTGYSNDLNNATYTYRTRTDMFRLFSLTQVYGMPEQPSIEGLSYQNDTPLIDVNNANFGLENVTIYVNGDTIKAATSYSFIVWG